MNSLLGVSATRDAVYFKQLFNSLPNPNLLIASSGSSRAVTFATAKNDAHIFSGIQTRKSGVLTMLNEIQGVEGTEFHVKFIKNIFSKLKLRRIIEEMLEAPLIGFQPLEVYWQKVFIDNQQYIVPRDIIGKPQEWFSFDSHNQPRFNAMGNVIGELLKPKKFLIVQHQASYNNPYGDAVLSKCLWPLVLKKGGMRFWLKFTEKYGMPHFVGKTDEVSGTPRYKSFEDALEDLIQDASAVISTTESIDVLNGGSTTANVSGYDMLVGFCNTEISKALLSQTLTTEIGQNGGAYAASKTHNEVLQTVIGADKYLVETALNELIKWIIEINFGKDIIPPKFIMFAKEDVDKPIAEVAELLQRNGTLKFLPPFYVNNFGFNKDEFEVLDPTAPPPTTQPTAPFTEHAEPAAPSDQTIIDAFADRAAEENSSLYLEYAKTIQSYLTKHKDFESAMKHIVDLLPEMDTKQIEQKLTNLLFMADVIGRISVQQEAK